MCGRYKRTTSERNWLDIITSQYHPNGILRGRSTPGCRSSYLKSITILGYLANQEEKSRSRSRQTE
jgi:hypothetical protein